MTDENKNREWQTPEPDALDRDLNATLAKYAAVEPRRGLEDRVLANLRAEREHITDRSPSRWSIVPIALAIVAVIIVAVALPWRSDRPRDSMTANHASTGTPNARSGPSLAANGRANSASPPVPAPTVRRVTHRVHPTTVAATPFKLDQFPSPQPLTEQELALAHYVTQFPQDATLIAQAQEQFEKEIQQATKDAHPEIEDNSSDQQER